MQMESMEREELQKLLADLNCPENLLQQLDDAFTDPLIR
jgi:hypothetical protein